ncbi:hypothetical protein AVEN_159762-1 [Araneus ventricosus]|uniref:Uncharacterized protein n=1 Tax=Araneus ventricosus TaxID=182803 RepID=A0A4Y2S3T6_ARAVE|nr:hypothetical protein AVEN_159762-1 [Araneus ventricosus]
MCENSTPSGGGGTEFTDEEKVVYVILCCSSLGLSPKTGINKVFRGLLHEPPVMVAILKEPQCLIMLSWQPVFQIYPDAIAGRGDVLLIRTETHRCDVVECEERNDFIRAEKRKYHE